MFIKPKQKSKLQIEIDKLVLELGNHQPDSDKFGDITEKLVKLHKINQDLTPDPVDPNTVLKVSANLIGIAMIIRHEHLNVITSKAMSFIPKA